MNIDARSRLAILYPVSRAARDRANPAESRFLKVFDAFASAGVATEPAIYYDDFRDEVLRQLLQVHGLSRSRWRGSRLPGCASSTHKVPSARPC